LWERGWFLARRIPPAPSAQLVLQERVDNLPLILSLANRAGLSPASRLDSQTDGHSMGLTEESGFQEGSLQMAREMWRKAKAVVSSARLAASIQTGA
jgi:hypothetical protein